MRIIGRKIIPITTLLQKFVSISPNISTNIIKVISPVPSNIGVRSLLKNGVTPVTSEVSALPIVSAAPMINIELH